MTTKQSFKERALERFDKEFTCTGGIPSCPLRHEPMLDELHDKCNPEKMKQWISSLLDEQRESILEMIREIRNNAVYIDEYCESGDCHFSEGLDVIDEIIKQIEEVEV